MTKNHVVDYADVLSDLRAKRNAIDKTIAQLEHLGVIGVLNEQPKEHNDQKIGNDVPKANGLANMTVYDAAVAILEKNGSPMKTNDIYKKMADAGKQFVSSKPASAVGVTLYKVLNDKKDCKIKLVGSGTWGLASW